MRTSCGLAHSERRGASAGLCPLGAVCLMLFACAAPAVAPDDRSRDVEGTVLDKLDLIPSQYAALIAGAQPDAVPPRAIALERRFHFAASVVDARDQLASVGLLGSTPVERVRVDVTETHLLIVRDRGPVVARAFEQQDTARSVLAAFPITGHFDLTATQDTASHATRWSQRDDAGWRPWWLRRYIRVDFSRNLADGYELVPGATEPSIVRAESLSAATPESPIRSVRQFRARGAPGDTGELDALDLTVYARLRLDQVRVTRPDGTDDPFCDPLVAGSTACGQRNVTLRVSLRRIDQAHDYVAQPITYGERDRFASFVAQPMLPTTHAQFDVRPRPRNFVRHDLWQHNHLQPREVTARRLPTLDHRMDDDACVTDGDCIVHGATLRCDVGTQRCGDSMVRCADDASCDALLAGSTCDFAPSGIPSAVGQCTLPMRERTAAPIAVHVSSDVPTAMLPSLEQAAGDWSETLSRAVREARARECILAGAGPGLAHCDGFRSPDDTRNADVRRLLVLCHDPVWGDDPSRDGHHAAADVADAQSRGWDLLACGEQGTRTRVGDLRQNTFVVANAVSDGSAVGSAWIGSDPVTGEIVASSIAVSLPEVAAQARWVTAFAQVLNGEASGDSNGVPAGSGLARLLESGWALRSDGPADFGAAEERAHVESFIRSLGPATWTGAWTERPDVVPRGAGWASELSEYASTVVVDDSRPGANAGRRLVRLASAATQRLAEMLALGPMGESARAVSAFTGGLRGGAVEQWFVAAPMDEIGDSASDELLRVASPARDGSDAARARARVGAAAHSSRACAMSVEPPTRDDIRGLLAALRSDRPPTGATFGTTWHFRVAPRPECNLQVDQCRMDWAEVERYLRLAAFYGFAVHELGHVLGARHNFAASADALNFRDEYWPLRANAALPIGAPQGDVGNVAPRIWHMARGSPMYADTEIDGDEFRFASSSVMDYRAWPHLTVGPGRYDYAFLLHRYAGMVEAFERVSRREDALSTFASTDGGYRSNVEPSFIGNPLNPVLDAVHYADLVRVMPVRSDRQLDVGESNRFPVFLRETLSAPYNTLGWDPEHPNVATAGRDGTRGEFLIVPHRSATDDWRGRVWDNNAWDSGADMFEVMDSLRRAEQSTAWFLADTWPRGSLTVGAYRARLRERYLEPQMFAARGALLVIEAYRWAFREWDYPGRFVSPGATGIGLAVNAMVEHLLRPTYSPTSTFNLVPQYDGSTIYVPSPRTLGSLRLEGDGRNVASDVLQRDGRWEVTRVGMFHDAQIAASLLLDAYVPPPGVAGFETADPTRYAVNVAAMFPGQTIRFFGSLLSHDYDDIALQVAPRTGMAARLVQAEFRSVNRPPGLGAGRNGRDPALHSVQPMMTVALERQIAATLFAGVRATRRDSFTDQLLVWSDGDPWSIAPSADREVRVFVEPTSGRRYLALHVGAAPAERGASVGLSRRDEPVNESGVAARVLRYAAFVAEAWRNAPLQAADEVQRALREYVSLLDAMRELSRTR